MSEIDIVRKDLWTLATTADESEIGPAERRSQASLDHIEAALARKDAVVEAARKVRGNDRAWTPEDYESYRLLHVALAALEEKP